MLSLQYAVVPTMQCTRSPCTATMDGKLLEGAITDSSTEQCSRRTEVQLAVQVNNAVQDDESFAVVPVAGENIAEECCIMVPETPPPNAPGPCCTVRNTPAVTEGTESNVCVCVPVNMCVYL